MLRTQEGTAAGDAWLPKGGLSRRPAVPAQKDLKKERSAGSVSGLRANWQVPVWPQCRFGPRRLRLAG